MDLAEIRKKAKTNNDRGEGQDSLRPRRERPPTSVQGAPEPQRDTAPPLTPSSVSGAAHPVEAAGGQDALEQLFGASLEVEFATEESYQEGLISSDSREQEETRQLLGFALGSEEYALDIESIREIIKPREITEVPRAPQFVLGIISLRGVILPVFDLKERLRLGSAELSPSSRIVVCQCDERIAGLLVDSISQVVRMPVDSIEPPPSVLSGLDRDLVEGVGRHQGRMMILLHLSCVMNAELV